MGVVLPPAAGFPDSFIRLVPIVDDIISEAYQGLLHFAIEMPAVKSKLCRGVNHLSVDIELQLIRAALPIRTGFESWYPRKCPNSRSTGALPP